MGSQLHFFATREDQIAMLAAVERNGPLQYILTGQLAVAEPAMFNGGQTIPTLGAAPHESAIAGHGYLVTRPKEIVYMKKVVQTDGQVRFHLSEDLNPTSIFLLHGGFYGDVLLYGRIGTISHDTVSKRTYNRFARVIRAQRNKIKTF